MRCLIASVETVAARCLISALHKDAPDHTWQLISSLDSPLPDVDFIFLFRWPHIVSSELVNSTRAKWVVFHTSELPRGRGGSPLQNQILEGKFLSRVNALELSDVVDAGRIYASQDVSLQGTADDIWLAIAQAAAKLAQRVVHGALPYEQLGEVTRYKRRKNNHLPSEGTPAEIHRFVQMLDGEGYPGAHVDYGNLRITFSRSSFRDGRILCDAVITLRED